MVAVHPSPTDFGGDDVQIVYELSEIQTASAKQTLLASSDKTNFPGAACA